MTAALPAPLTPAECDLRDFPRMMIDISRLRTSVFDSTLDDAAWRAGMNLWMSAFHSVPAGALEDDEGVLCKASGLNRDVKTWRKVRAAAMRGFVKCSDGRWYHETVAEFVLEAWLEKLAHRLSSGAGNAKRWGITFDPEPIKDAIASAAALLATLNPASKAIPKASRHMSRRDPGGIENLSQQEGENVPSGSQGTGTGTGKGQEEPNPNPPPTPDQKIISSFVVGRGKREGGGVTIEDPNERIARFQKTIAQALGKNGWTIVAAAADPTSPDYEQALQACKSAAQRIGKGWPRLWPAPQHSHAAGRA
jgi:hypothetical protein